MVPTNILQQTFKIKYGDSIGTCFTIDIEDKQYIITARHVVEKIMASDMISIQHNKQWVNLSVGLVGLCPDDVDVAVLSPSKQLSPAHALIPDTSGLYLSEDIYFLGFPYGLQIEVGPELNADFPLPLVKKGIVSSFEFQANVLSLMLLDGHNNPGFSGGPVYYSAAGKNDSRVAGVISGYRYEWEPVYAQGQATDFKYQGNTGIIVAWSINHALKVIQANPIGAAIQRGVG
jgi:hypothetical protein